MSVVFCTEQGEVVIASFDIFVQTYYYDMSASKSNQNNLL